MSDDKKNSSPKRTRERVQKRIAPRARRGREHVKTALKKTIRKLRI